ncbi:uncharacterized protein TNCV_2197491 [Trichonephila clavipes]|nr:uncharacterized protein TNCV_2197491 [Trichonephila clavipes]
MNATERINDGASTIAAEAVEIIQDDEIASILTPDYIGINCVRTLFMKTHWAATSARFPMTFVNYPFGYKYDVCDRLWFLRSLKPTKEKHVPLLNSTFLEELMANFKLCATSKNCFNSNKVPTLSRLNGFVYPLPQVRAQAKRVARIRSD